MNKTVRFFLCWLLMAADALGCFTLQLLFMKDTGRTDSSFLFSSTVYKVNTLCLVLGYVLFPAVHLVLWRFFQRDQLERVKELGVGSAVVYCLGVMCFCFLVFLASIWILFAGFTGMTINIEPEIAEFNGLIFAAYIFLFTVVSLIITFKKNKS